MSQSHSHRLPTSFTLPLIFRGTGAGRKPAVDDLNNIYKHSSPSQLQRGHIPIPHVSNDRHQRALKGESWGLQRAREAGIVRSRVRAQGNVDVNEDEERDEEAGVGNEVELELEPATKKKKDSLEGLQSMQPSNPIPIPIPIPVPEPTRKDLGGAMSRSRSPLSVAERRHVPLSHFLPAMVVQDEQWVQDLTEPTELVDLGSLIRSGAETHGSVGEAGQRQEDEGEGKVEVEVERTEGERETATEESEVAFAVEDRGADDEAEWKKSEEEKCSQKKDLTKYAQHSAKSAPPSPLKILRQEASTELCVDKDLPPLPAIPQEQGACGRASELGLVDTTLNMNKTLPPTPQASSPASGRLLWGFDDGEIVEDAKLRGKAQGRSVQQVDGLIESVQALAVKIKEDRKTECRSLASHISNEIEHQGKRDLGYHVGEEVEDNASQERAENEAGETHVGSGVRLFKPTSLRVLEVANTRDLGSSSGPGPEEPIAEDVETENKLVEHGLRKHQDPQTPREEASASNESSEQLDTLEETLNSTDDSGYPLSTIAETHEATPQRTNMLSPDQQESSNQFDSSSRSLSRLEGLVREKPEIPRSTVEKVLAATERLKAILRDREIQEQEEEHGIHRQQSVLAHANLVTGRPRRVAGEREAQESNAAHVGSSRPRDSAGKQSGGSERAEQSVLANDKGTGLKATGARDGDEDWKMLRRVAREYA
ncbi:hypothetical protein K491DRAFT_674128 [Lophiostoma macrostomum CBS 122681]|uniref:Uncharacterized protein n=1 Tax=Lophiostoma macrostomum CBS 122681 TaxID=1314788 RepID=A0A6A6TR92_9PLEO|nr:hypothetical protein K491DRAFT_674128 [Lophiostoma macrostomum CBS 122681]